MEIKKKYYINYNLVLSIIVFFIISILSLSSADRINQSVNNIIFKQIMWYFIGIISIVFIMYIGNKNIFKQYKSLYIIGNILLLILLFCSPINNARCWFKIKGIGTIQPSEFIKIILVIFISIYLSKNNKHKESKKLTNVILILLLPSILTFLEPDTGAVFMYFILAAVILFVSGIRYRWFNMVFIIGISIIMLILYLYFFNINYLIKIFGNSFFLRIERLINWSSLEGMQLENSIIAIGSSGIKGHGLNNTPIYIPEAHTDFIFAVYSSNFGFIGNLILIINIIFFDFTLLNIISKSKKKINVYIISGILGIILYQQIQNIGMTFGLLPITGITLPFVSYGGSSLISYMIMLGFIFNIHNENKQYKN